MEGQPVELSASTRYPGVQLDSKLLWTTHFNKVAARPKQYLMQLMGALNKKWGPKPKLVRWIYIAIVRPRITFAALVWSHNINQKTKLKKLMQINRLASMMMASAHSSNSSKSYQSAWSPGRTS